MEEDEVTIFALGQSGFVLLFPSGRILVDGFFSQHPDRLVDSPFAALEAHGFDLIAFTHEHGDHMDLEAVPDLAKASPECRFIAPRPCTGLVSGAGVAAERVVGMQPGEPVTLHEIEVHAVSARHALKAGDPYTFGTETANGMVRFLGYVFRANGVAVYHAGDTLDYEGLADSLRTLQVDVALLPINGRDFERERRGIAGNLDPDEAANLAMQSGVDVVIPTHYDMFASNPGYPEELVRAVREKKASVKVVVLPAGQAFVYTKPRTLL